MRLRAFSNLLSLFALLCSPALSVSAPSVPGFVVTHYVSGIVKPYRLTFSAAGVLFVGNNRNVAPEWVERVPVGGATFSHFGNNPYSDPDAVVVDAQGIVSGTAGAVVVGRGADGGVGILTAVLPNQSVVTIDGPSAALGNPDDLVFDRTGRLLITDFLGSNVLVKSGIGPSSILFVNPSKPVSIGVDAANRIHTSAEDGIVRIYSANGAPLNSTFLSGLPEAPLEFGPGGNDWGSDLYCVNNSNGELLRVDTSGTATTIGTGFSLIADIAFGPDSLMYLSMYNDSLVLRVFPERLVGVTTRSNAEEMTLTAMPNPARRGVELEVSQPTAGLAEISVVSVDGRLARRIHDGVLKAGRSRWKWDGADSRGRSVPPGLYFARLRSGQRQITCRIALIH